MTEPAATDLELELRVGEPNGRTVEVEVLRSPAGEATETTTLPFDTLELDNRLKDVQLALLGRSATTRRIVPEHERAVEEFGDLLFDTVFTGEVRSLLDRSREEAISQGVGLRVKLRFESADMASLPWEFLHDTRATSTSPSRARHRSCGTSSSPNRSDRSSSRGPCACSP